MTVNNWSWETFDAEAFYDDLGYGEWNRLDRDWYHRLEWEGTIEYLDRHLPDNGHVLDAGGGAGRYTVWLAEHGYDVTLIDISERQLEIAAEQLTERGLTDRVGILRGDIRALGIDSGVFDATLCLGGPLSHITDRTRRETAVSELARVTKPDRPVFVSVMGRLAMVQALIQQAGSEETDQTALLADFAERGTYDRELLEAHGQTPQCFAAHFFRVAELERLFSTAGIDTERIIGLEGIASLRRVGRSVETPQIREALDAVVELFRTDETVADISTHILAIGSTT